MPPVYIVDAFTELPFSGNQAAVVIADGEAVIDDGMKQKIAAEMQLSETSFVELVSFARNGCMHCRPMNPP